VSIRAVFHRSISPSSTFLLVSYPRPTCAPRKCTLQYCTLTPCEVDCLDLAQSVVTTLSDQHPLSAYGPKDSTPVCCPAHHAWCKDTSPAIGRTRSRVTCRFSGFWNKPRAYRTYALVLRIVPKPSKGHSFVVRRCLTNDAPCSTSQTRADRGRGLLYYQCDMNHIDADTDSQY